MSILSYHFIFLPHWSLFFSFYVMILHWQHSGFAELTNTINLFLGTVIMRYMGWILIDELLIDLSLEAKKTHYGHYLSLLWFSFSIWCGPSTELVQAIIWKVCLFCVIYTRISQIAFLWCYTLKSGIRHGFKKEERKQ